MTTVTLKKLLVIALLWPLTARPATTARLDKSQETLADLFDRIYNESDLKSSNYNLIYPPFSHNLFFMSKTPAPSIEANEETLLNKKYTIDEKGNRILDPTQKSFTEKLRLFSTVYKIHLMPKSTDIERVLRTLMREIALTPFGKKINTFKVTKRDLKVGPPAPYDKDPYDQSFPLIVIYPEPGEAQAVLEHIATLLPDLEGIQKKDLSEKDKKDFKDPSLDEMQKWVENHFNKFTALKSSSPGTPDSRLVPRFNVVAKTRSGRPSSWIYYAQGNADYKYRIRIRLSDGPNVPDELKSRYKDDRSKDDMSVAELLFDPRENYALLLPNLFTTRVDFHLYLPERTGRTPPIPAITPRAAAASSSELPRKPETLDSQAAPQPSSAYDVLITVHGNHHCYIVPQYTPKIWESVHGPRFQKLNLGTNDIRFNSHVTSPAAQLTGFVVVLHSGVVSLYGGGPRLTLPLRHHYTVECNEGEVPQLLD